MATNDEDDHGIAVGGNNGRVEKIWLLENNISKTSGTGIHIGNQEGGDNALVNNIYVGRNWAYKTRQSGFFSKKATDVIFSENIANDIISTSEVPNHQWTSYSKAFGFQYGPNRVSYLFNKGFNTEYGIYSGSGTGPGDILIIGNSFYNIHSKSGIVHTDIDGWQFAGIMLAGGGSTNYIVGNTIHDADSGISSPSGMKLRIENNIISKITRSNANHIYLQNVYSLSNSVVRNNLFYQPWEMQKFDGEKAANLG
jgi:hypothetical protein